MTITIKGTNLDLTPTLKQYAMRKILAVGKFSPDIILADIELERTTRHHHKGKVWRAEVNLHGLPRLIRAEAIATDIYAAIDEAQDELKRELKNIKDKGAIGIRKARQALSRRRAGDERQ